MDPNRYSKAELVFGRKESGDKYLIYSAKTRGIHIVSGKIFRVWKKCNSSSLAEISRKTGFSKKDIKKILPLLIKRGLVKVD